MSTSREHRAIKGVNGIAKDIRQIIRILPTIDGNFYEITLMCGQCKEVRLFQYKHNDFNS